MEKIIIMEKLKFVSSTCRSLQIKLNEDLNQGTGTLPQFTIDEYKEVIQEIMEAMQEIKQKADYWLYRKDRQTDSDIPLCDIASSACGIFECFNKIISILSPEERMRL